LVDPAKFDSPWETEADVPPSALGLKDLAEEAAGRGIRLFIENSGQPIRSLGLLVGMVRESLPSEQAAYLGLCLDPINSLRADPSSDPIAEIEAIPLDHIFMVHFKQTIQGKPHPTVDDGDLDFTRLLQMLRTRNYQGPAILEIPPGEEAFDNFAKSIKYLEPLMAPAN
jgi:sugar phosphate isomerase/epimerase